jgi:TP901 family phage tail tape measure protein
VLQLGTVGYEFVLSMTGFQQNAARIKQEMGAVQKSVDSSVRTMEARAKQASAALRNTVQSVSFANKKALDSIKAAELSAERTAAQLKTLNAQIILENRKLTNDIEKNAAAQRDAWTKSKEAFAKNVRERKVLLQQQQDAENTARRAVRNATQRESLLGSKQPNTQAHINAVTDLEHAQKRLATTLEKNKLALILYDAEANKLKNTQTKLKIAVDDATLAEDKQRQKLKDLTVQHGILTKQQQASIDAVSAARVAEARTYNQGLHRMDTARARSAESAKRHADAVAGAQAKVARQIETLADRIDLRLRRHSSDLKAFGADLMQWGQTIGRFLAGAVTQFAELDQAMRHVNVLIKETPQGLEGVTREIMKLGERLGIMPVELAKGLREIASSDFTAAESMKVMEVAAESARGGFADMKDTTSTLISVIKSFNLTADDASRVSDILFKTVKIGRIEFNQFKEPLSQASAMAARAGVSVEELGAMLAMLTINGRLAASTGTSLANMFSKIINPSEGARKAAGKLGLEWFELGKGQEQIRKFGLAKVLDDIAKATKGNVSALADLFPEMRGFIATLIATNKEGKTFRNFLAGTRDSAGARAEALAEEMKGLRAQLDRVNVEFVNMVTEIGRELVPAVQRLIAGAKDLMQRWRSLTDGQRSLIIQWSAWSAAILVSIGFIARLTGNLYEFVRGATATYNALVTLVTQMNAANISLTTMRGLLLSVGTAASGLFIGWGIGQLLIEFTKLDDMLDAVLWKLFRIRNVRKEEAEMEALTEGQTYLRAADLARQIQAARVRARDEGIMIQMPGSDIPVRAKASAEDIERAGRDVLERALPRVRDAFEAAAARYSIRVPGMPNQLVYEEVAVQLERLAALTKKKTIKPGDVPDELKRKMTEPGELPPGYEESDSKQKVAKTIADKIAAQALLQENTEGFRVGCQQFVATIIKRALGRNIFSPLGFVRAAQGEKEIARIANLYKGAPKKGDIGFSPSATAPSGTHSYIVVGTTPDGRAIIMQDSGLKKPHLKNKRTLSAAETAAGRFYRFPTEAAEVDRALDAEAIEARRRARETRKMERDTTMARVKGWPDSPSRWKAEAKAEIANLRDIADEAIEAGRISRAVIEANYKAEEERINRELTKKIKKFETGALVGELNAQIKLLQTQRDTFIAEAKAAEAAGDYMKGAELRRAAAIKEAWIKQQKGTRGPRGVLLGPEILQAAEDRFNAEMEAADVEYRRNIERGQKRAAKLVVDGIVQIIEGAAEAEVDRGEAEQLRARIGAAETYMKSEHFKGLMESQKDRITGPYFRDVDKLRALTQVENLATFLQENADRQEEMTILGMDQKDMLIEINAKLDAAIAEDMQRPLNERRFSPEGLTQLRKQRSTGGTRLGRLEIEDIFRDADLARSQMEADMTRARNTKMEIMLAMRHSIVKQLEEQTTENVDLVRTLKEKKADLDKSIADLEDANADYRAKRRRELEVEGVPRWRRDRARQAAEMETAAKEQFDRDREAQLPEAEAEYRKRLKSADRLRSLSVWQEMADEAKEKLRTIPESFAEASAAVIVEGGKLRDWWKSLWQDMAKEVLATFIKRAIYGFLEMIGVIRSHTPALAGAAAGMFPGAAPGMAGGGLPGLPGILFGGGSPAGTPPFNPNAPSPTWGVQQPGMGGPLGGIAAIGSKLWGWAAANPWLAGGIAAATFLKKPLKGIIRGVGKVVRKVARGIKKFFGFDDPVNDFSAQMAGRESFGAITDMGPRLNPASFEQSGRDFTKMWALGFMRGMNRMAVSGPATGAMKGLLTRSEQGREVLARRGGLETSTARREAVHETHIHNPVLLDRAAISQLSDKTDRDMANKVKLHLRRGVNGGRDGRG